MPSSQGCTPGTRQAATGTTSGFGQREQQRVFHAAERTAAGQGAQPRCPVRCGPPVRELIERSWAAASGHVGSGPFAEQGVDLGDQPA